MTADGTDEEKEESPFAWKSIKLKPDTDATCCTGSRKRLCSLHHSILQHKLMHIVALRFLRLLLSSVSSDIVRSILPMGTKFWNLNCDGLEANGPCLVDLVLHN